MVARRLRSSLVRHQSDPFGRPVGYGSDRPAGGGAHSAVLVWLIRLDVPAETVARVVEVLDDGERARAARLGRPGHERRYVVAHGAARVIIGDFADVAAGQVEWQAGPNGKPELAGDCRGVQVSLSHSGHLAVLAITRGRRVGVDVQQIPARMDPVRMAERFYPPDEARFVTVGAAEQLGWGGGAGGAEQPGWGDGAGGPDRPACVDDDGGVRQPGLVDSAGGAGQLDRFIRLWARKEACVKAAGGVLMQGMRLPVRGTGRILVRNPGGALPGPYLVQDVAVPRGLHSAVAAEGAEPYDARCQWWPADLG